MSFLTASVRPLRAICRAGVRIAAIGAAVSAIGSASVATAGDLSMVSIPVMPNDLRRLESLGLDVARISSLDELGEETGPARLQVDAVVTSAQRTKLRAMGFELISNNATNVALAARAQAAADGEVGAFGFSVYRSFDEPGGIRERIESVAASYPEIAQLETFGTSVQGRPLFAVRLGKPAVTSRGRALAKPEMLFVSVHHAREWMAAEMGIRLLEYLAQSYGNDSRVTALLDSVDVWLVPNANPDGYEYTFTDERLWRKNLTDNDGDGAITINDGVDLNRNFGSRWGYDDEGSEPVPASFTYRGTAPFSTPENAAMRDFMVRHDFQYLVSYHTFGNLILYPVGWQVKTPSFDNEMFLALAGTDAEPSVVDSANGVGYDPGLSADLYITNGEFTDWAYAALGIPGFTMELTPGNDADNGNYGFVFPDDEALVQSVFEDNLEFALSVAESALTPSDPVSPIGLVASPIAHEPLLTSFGRTQPVVVSARKHRRRPVLTYSIDDRRERRTAFLRRRGEFYNERSGVHYDRYVANIRGQRPGSTVRYSIAHEGQVFGPYEYVVEQVSRNPVLIMAAEDYTGGIPDYTETGGSNESPNYLQYYTSALDDAGIGYDVWDVDARGAAPDAEGVLSHYKAVIWYSGDDYAPETLPEFTIHDDEYVNLRRYINYFGGKLLATGQDLGWIATIRQYIDSNGEPRSDDFFQYYLGALQSFDSGGADADGVPFEVVGNAGDPIFGGLQFNIAGGTGANNQVSPTEFLHTSQALEGFNDVPAAAYVRTGGAAPFAPFSGDYYLYSNQLDVSYKRLGGTFEVPADAPRLTFRTSYDIERDWDYAIVEVRPVGTENWTTLPEAGGATTTSTGESCPAGWIEQLHAELASYQALQADGTCISTGTSGEWHALTGNSGGWQQLEYSLEAYAGQAVEIYVAYVSDWGTQNFGMFIDDVRLGNGPLQDFEQGIEPLQVTSTAAGELANNWERRTGDGFVTSSAIRTPFSLFLGFGFEAIDSAGSRADLMRNTMRYFGAVR